MRGEKMEMLPICLLMKLRKAHFGFGKKYIKISQSGDVYYSKHISQRRWLPALLHICFSAACARF